MTFSSILGSEIQVGDPITQALMQKIKDNDDYLYGLIGGLDYYDIYNGSLDIDSDADGKPDGWTVTTYPGGSYAMVSAATPGHGTYEFQATHPGGAGNGGAILTSPYIAATGKRQYFFGFCMDLSSGATGIKIELEVERFGYNKASLGANVSLYSTTSNYTTTHRQYWVGWGPGVANDNLRFFRLKFILGNNDTNQAGTIGISGISMATSMPQLFSAATFTFAERTTSTTGSFADLGSAISIDLPHDWWFVGNVPLMLIFPVEMRWTTGPGTGDIGQFRFTANSGGDASNVLFIPADAVGNGTTAFLSGIIMLKTSPVGESFTVQPQGYISTGAGTIGLTKGTGVTSVSLMTPGS